MCCFIMIYNNLYITFFIMVIHPQLLHLDWFLISYNIVMLEIYGFLYQKKTRESKLFINSILCHSLYFLFEVVFYQYLPL